VKALELSKCGLNAAGAGDMAGVVRPERRARICMGTADNGTYVARWHCRAQKEHSMTDNKNPNEKQPGEKPEGKYHYNPGNQSGKVAKSVPKEKAEKDD
jgi:hypothetical protein